jgi:hypothetical protein
MWVASSYFYAQSRLYIGGDVERLDIQRGRVGPLGHDWLDESEVVHIERPFGGIGWATSKYGGGDGPAGLTVEHEEDRMPKSDRRDVATLFVGASLLSLVVVAADPPGARAQSFIGFGSSFQYDQGLNPSVAVSGGTVVEVHNGTGGVGPLWYRVGKVNPSTVTWNDSHQYDNGFNPSVAVNGATVVEVHNGGAGAGPSVRRMFRSARRASARRVDDARADAKQAREQFPRWQNENERPAPK